MDNDKLEKFYESLDNVDLRPERLSKIFFKYRMLKAIAESDQDGINGTGVRDKILNDFKAENDSKIFPLMKDVNISNVDLYGWLEDLSPPTKKGSGVKPLIESSKTDKRKYVITTEGQEFIKYFESYIKEFFNLFFKLNY